MRNNIASIVLGVFIAITLVFSPFATLFQTPKVAQAQGGNPVLDPPNTIANIISKVEEGYQTVKEYGLDEAAKLAALKVLKGLVADTINWANEGFQDEPLFIQNRQNFLTRIENEQIVNLVESFQSFEEEGQGDDVPYWRAAAQSIVGSQTQRFSEQITSTFEEDTGVTVETFESDFNSGGWDGFLAFTQKENNNPLDFHNTVSREIEDRIANAGSAFQSEFESGDGFISMQACKSYKAEGQEPEKEINNYSFSSFGTSFTDSSTSENCETWEKTTPGSVIAAQIFDATISPMQQAAEADEVTDVLTNVLFVLFDELTMSGLSELTSSSSNSGNENQAGLNLQAEVADILGPQGSGGGAGQNTSNSNQDSEWLDNPDLLIGIGDELNTSIELINEELKYLDQINLLMNDIPDKARLLDQCILGPDLGWKDRIRQLYQRRSEKLERNAAKDNNSAEGASDRLEAQKNFLSPKIAAIDIAMINDRLSLDHPDTIENDTIRWKNSVDAVLNMTSERERFRDRRIEKQRLRGYLLSVEKRYAALSGGLTFLEQELEEEQDNLATAEAELAALNAEYEQINSKFESQEQEIEELEQEISHQKSLLSLKEDDAAEKFEEAQELLQPQTQSPTSSGTSGSNSPSANQLQSISNSLDQEIGQEKNDLAVSESQLTHAETQLQIGKSKDIELQQILDDIAEKKSEISSIQAEINSLNQQIEEEILYQQQLSEDPDLTEEDIREAEREEINEMIKRYRSLQRQITTRGAVDEVAAEAGKLDEAISQYDNDIESCQEARLHMAQDPELEVEWQLTKEDDPVDVNLGALLVLFDAEKKLFCNGPRLLFERDINQGWEKNRQWFQIFERGQDGPYQACRTWPEENDKTIYDDREEPLDGYYECGNSSDANSNDDLLMPQDRTAMKELFNELDDLNDINLGAVYDSLDNVLNECLIGCGDMTDIFGGHYAFWKKENADFPKDMPCTDWYESSTSDYLGEGAGF